MYIHKIKKEKLEEVRYNYQGKQTKNKYGDYILDFSKMRIEEHKNFVKYIEAKKIAYKKFKEERGEYDYTAEYLDDLKKMYKEVFYQFFETSGDFMITITMKGLK